MYKTAGQLDFFRGEKGMKDMPYLFHDSNLKKESMATPKAFFDIQCEDAEVWARWGAIAFDKQLHRQACSNEPMTLDLGLTAAGFSRYSHKRSVKLANGDVWEVSRQQYNPNKH
eukprot:584696-Amphidinium_carterae.1